MFAPAAPSVVVPAANWRLDGLSVHGSLTYFFNASETLLCNASSTGSFRSRFSLSIVLARSKYPLASLAAPSKVGLAQVVICLGHLALLERRVQHVDALVQVIAAREHVHPAVRVEDVRVGLLLLAKHEVVRPLGILKPLGDVRRARVLGHNARQVVQRATSSGRLASNCSYVVRASSYRSPAIM